jgi:hypothetical protein
MSESQDWVEFGVTRDIHKKAKVAKPTVRKESAELKAIHKAFEAHITEEYTAGDMFNDYTLDRNEYGSYTNLSVKMQYPDFKAGWIAAKKFFKKED